MSRRGLSRRALVRVGGATLAASRLSAAAVVPAAAGSPPTGLPGAAAVVSDPDADLTALGRRWRASADRCERLRATLDAAEARIRPVPPPEVLFYRPEADGDWIGAFVGSAPWNGCLCYVEAAQITRLRRWSAPQPLAERRAEILAAYEAWQEALDREQDASGYTRAFAEDSEARQENTALRAAILATPAATMAGLAVKVAVAVWCHGLIADIAAELADRAARGPGAVEAAEVSILLDLARMLLAEDHSPWVISFFACAVPDLCDQYQI